MRNHLFQNLGYQNILSPLSLALILSPSVSHSHVLMEASTFEGEKKKILVVLIRLSSREQF